MGRAFRRGLLGFIVAGFVGGTGCSGDVETPRATPPAAAGAGAAGAATGGVGGLGSAGGGIGGVVSGVSGCPGARPALPTTCAEPWSLCEGVCPNGTASRGTVLRGSGFTSFEGAKVHASFAAMQATPTIKDGAFTLDILNASTNCAQFNIAPSGIGALYIDVNGDSKCDPAVDGLYVWAVSHQANCRPIDVTPVGPRCVFDDPLDERYLRGAAQQVCPALTGCLDICGAPNGGGAGAPIIGGCAQGGENAGGATVGGAGGQGGAP